VKVLVVGASRGIGLEFVRQYRAAGDEVHATARSDDGLAALRALGAIAIKLDVADAASASGLAWQVDGAAFDVAIVNAGVYGPRTAALEVPSEADFDLVMRTNVLGAMRVVAQLDDALAPGAKLVVLSSGMASIGGRAGSSGWLYSASKAALNSVLKSAAFALEGRAVCVAVSPGWVQTDMGGPAAPLTVGQSVSDLRDVIARLGPNDHGSFIKHDGHVLPW
jgi:NAD(P)-dependent dehydrogenase (short-subunit alcohol dehydrogenase family)